ncbi:hypothetical protein NZA98_06870, partial [Escherichia coli]|nr:hypothetical protein [Escherichia coli]
GVPSSTTHGRDVKGLHGHEDVIVGEIAIGVIIGRTSEFFDVRPMMTPMAISWPCRPFTSRPCVVDEGTPISALMSRCAPQS